MRTYITSIFDKNHLARAMACRASLLQYAPDSPIYWLCLDEDCYAMAQKLNLKNTTVLRPSDINDTELLAVRPTRTNPEFASTCKPALLRYMMRSNIVNQGDLLAFVDPDFYFYFPAQSFFEKVYHSGSIAITPHRFPIYRQHESALKGIFNAGIVFFKKDTEALKCLEEWRLQCLDWCYLRYKNGQIGDQGYLNDWPKKYSSVYEIPNKGVNLSTWNIENYKIIRKSDGNIRVDNEPLICYHFHGLKLYLNGTNRLRAYPITVFHIFIYKKCLEGLQDAYTVLQQHDPSWKYGTLPRLHILRIIKQRAFAYIRRK